MKKIIALLFFLCASSSFAKTLTVAYAEFNPVSYTENGEVKGYAIDLLKELAPKVGYKLKFIRRPVKRIISSLEDGSVDLWVGVKSLPKEGTTVSNDKVVTELILNSYSQADAPSLSKADEIKDSTMGVIRGYSYGTWGKYIRDKGNNIRSYETESHTQVFKMLKANRVKYVLGYDFPSKLAMNKLGMNGIKKTHISTLPCYFILSNKSKNIDNSGKLLKDITSALVAFEKAHGGKSAKDIFSSKY